MSPAMSWGLDAAKAGEQLSWSTELNIKDKELLSFHQLLSTLGWRNLITRVPGIKPLLTHTPLAALISACKYITKWAVCLQWPATLWHCQHCPELPTCCCQGCCREENLPSLEMRVFSLPSVPSSQGGRWIPSLRNSHTWSDCIWGNLAVSLSQSTSMGGQKVMFMLLLGTLKPADFHSLVSSASQPNHSFTSPKVTKAVKTLSLKGTKDFLFLPISPKSSSALMFLESLLF